MEKQNKLAKLALAGLLLASCLPMEGQAVNEVAGTLLATGCAAHGCGGESKPKGTSSKEVADSSDENMYRTESGVPSNGQQANGAKMKTSAQNAPGKDTMRMNGTPETTPEKATPPSYSRNTPRGNSQYSYAISENEPATSPSKSMTKVTMTKSQLIEQLNAQGKAIFSSLDADGQDLALSLASQDSYTDKNLAVKEAQRRINEQRGMKKF